MRRDFRSFVPWLVAVALVTANAPAQQQTPMQVPSSAEDDDASPIHTLHVYMDLIQVPVLVLDPERERMKPIDSSRFLVSLDSGPAFHPRAVRRQGEDPITLGILLDPSSEPDAMRQIDSAVAALAPRALHPQDHVSLFVMNCGLMRALDDVPADSAVLRAGVLHGLESWRIGRKEKHPAPCAARVPLWDSVAYVVQTLARSPGRRALLVVSNGHDSGSKVKWNDLRQYAQSKGVAIFGYASPALNISPLSQGLGSAPSRSSRSIAQTATGAIPGSLGEEDPYDSLCQLSGGMIQYRDPTFVEKDLLRFITILRERYILEFSRPRNDAPGEHDLLVFVSKTSNKAYIRPAGVTILMPDAAAAADPNTIQRDTSNAPELGKRKPIAAK